MRKALGIDVGGTKIYNAIINEKGEILSEIEKRPTPKSFAEIQAVFKEIIEKHENEVDVIAFSTCGAVNKTNDGILGSTGNIAKEYPTMNFKSLSQKPVFVENDANCAAWAEYVIGSSKNMPYSVMITLGTGVGGGIIIDGKLYKGKSGAAGEMHFKMRTDKHRKCTCGSWDCFEAYASGTGLKLTAEEISGDKEITTYDVIENLDRPIMKKIFNVWPYRPEKKGAFGMFLEDEWYCLTAKKEIRSEDAVEGLDVSLLQNYLLNPVLGIEDPKTDKRIDFVGGIRGLAELERRVHTDMKVAFSMYPTSIGELFAVADAGRLMPPKSTWFEPKLRSGLFLHEIER